MLIVFIFLRKIELYIINIKLLVGEIISKKQLEAQPYYMIFYIKFSFILHNCCFYLTGIIYKMSTMSSRYSIE